MNQTPPDPSRDPATAPAEQKLRRAGPLQVAKTMFFGLFAIGMKGTIEKDGAKVTPGQLVVGGILGGILLVVLIASLARFVIRMAMS
jgi:hypothetical protein